MYIVLIHDGEKYTLQSLVESKSIWSPHMYILKNKIKFQTYQI